MTLFVHRAARLADLHRAVAALPAPRDPFRAELVFVPSQALASPLLADIAHHRGVAAHIDVRSHTSLLLHALSVAAPHLQTTLDAARETPWHPSRLVWTIAEALGDSLQLQSFRTLAQHLQPARGVVDGPLWQLARSLADSFHRYPEHRPDLVRQWEAGSDSDDWQACLWRTVTQRLATPHPTALWATLADAIRQGAPLPPSWPETLAVLGWRGLPAQAFDALDAIAKDRDVHIFGLSFAEPTTAAATFVARHSRADGTFSRWLANRAPDAAPRVFHDQAAAPDTASLLGYVQHQLSGRTVTPPSAPDSTLVIHACHGPMRQVEAVRDTLLALLDADPTLHPRDLVIATPDIARYAPLLDAVLAERLPPPHPGDAAPPVLVSRAADLPERRSNPLADTLLAALDLASTRLVLDDVVAFLGRPTVMRTLELDDDTLRHCRDWFTEAGIRWGRDEHHRRALGQPAVRLHAWRHGFDRLLLGYALTSDDFGSNGPWDDLAPVAAVEGSEVVVLGRCIDFIERLFDSFEAMATPRDAARWRQLLSDLCRTLAGTDPDHITLLQDIIGPISDLRISEHLRIDLPTMRSLVGDLFRDTRARPSFQPGGVNIVPLRALRSRRCRVLCLVGLDDGALARDRLAPGFDHIANNPRPDDPHPGDDERAAWLEFIASANDALHIFFTRHDPRDRTTSEPAAPVVELVRLIRTTTGLQPESREHAELPCVPSPYPRWDPRIVAAPPFKPAARPGWPADAPLPPRPTGPTRELPLRTLTDILTEPHRHVMQSVLGVIYPRLSDAPQRREPLEPNHLERFFLAERLTELYLRGIPEGRARVLLQADGQLPWGHAADIVFKHLHQQASTFARTLVDLVEHHTTAREPRIPLLLETARIECTVAGTTVRGTLGGMVPDAARRDFAAPPDPKRQAVLPPPLRLQWRCGRLRPRDEIRCWTEHLALTASLPEAPVSIFVHRDRDTSQRPGIYRLPALPRALALRTLAELVALHDRMREKPPHFRPDTGRAWYMAVDRAAGGRGEPDLREARQAWFSPKSFGRDEPGGDQLDVSARLLTEAAWTPAYPFDHHDFRDAAWRIFAPLRAVLRWETA